MPSQALLHAALFCPGPEGFWGLPLLLWGEPGTGKTSNVAQVAAQTRLPYRRLSPAECGEGQFGVVPVPTVDGVLNYPPPVWVREFNESGILFIDEINTAAPALQAPLLGLVQLRTLGAHVFGKRVRIVGAANAVSDGAGAWDLAPAINNRFGHLDFHGLDAQAWAEALLGGFGRGGAEHRTVDAAAEEARVLAHWDGALASARGLVSGFIQRKPDLLHKKPQKGGGRAWPSRRTWEYVVTALASARVHGLSEIDTDELCAAFVGQAPITEFRTWLAQADLPDPAEVLDGRVKFTHEARRPDRTWAVLGACTALVVPKGADKRDARATALWNLIADVCKLAPDYAVPAARALAENRIVPPAGFKALAALQPVLAAAGIRAV